MADIHDARPLTSAELRRSAKLVLERPSSLAVTSASNAAVKALAESHKPGMTAATHHAHGRR